MSSHDAAGELEGKRAVIVEDEGMTMLQLRNILRRRGVQVVGTAPNGAAGVEMVLREKPDLVLMDVQMPVMDGMEASRRILETQKVCIVIITAFAEEHRETARQLGACGYVVKPIDGTALVPLLEQAYLRHTTGGCAG